MAELPVIRPKSLRIPGVLWPGRLNESGLFSADRSFTPCEPALRLLLHYSQKLHDFWRRDVLVVGRQQSVVFDRIVFPSGALDWVPLSGQ
jgi:hypothetical protein